MRTSVWRAARVTHCHSRPQICRFIVGRRFPLLRRAFLSSPKQNREDDTPSAPETIWNHIAENPTPIPKLYDNIQEVESSAGGGDGAPLKPPRPTERNYYGSGMKRATRGASKKKEIPPFQIPRWFMERNVVLQESYMEKANEASTGSQLHEKPTKPDSAEDLESSATQGTVSEAEHESPGSLPDEISSSSDKNLVNKARPLEAQIAAEISMLVSAGLQVPTSENSQKWKSPKPHLVLHCPKDGGTRYLDNLVKGLARTYATDLIKFDAQDIAQIGSDYLEDPNKVSLANSLSSLGYDAHLMTTSGGSQWTEEPVDEEEYDEPEDEDDKGRSDRTPFQQGSTGILPIASFGAKIPSIFKTLPQIIMSSIPQSSLPSRVVKIAPPPTEKDLKTSVFVETLLDACETKRRTDSNDIKSNDSIPPRKPKDEGPSDVVFVEQSVGDSSSPNTDSTPRTLIVHIEDYLEINATFNGGKILDKLHEIVGRRRKEGQKILIIGTTSSQDLIPSFSEAGFKDLQSQQENGPTRTIITPLRVSMSTLDHERKQRIRMINQRHLQEMLRRLAADPTRVVNLVSQEQLDLASSVEFLSEMKEFIWPMDRVHRAATVALGSLQDDVEMTTKHIEEALALIELSDTKKFEWAAKENEKEKARKTSKSSKSTRVEASMSPDESEERMKKLRRTCNKHEKKLLNGVIDPNSIRTTFADVRAPPATIEALKTLTSLSLVRPDAFTYGVLATDKIPGLLLYGPPGTGKTLLAKAVAKESGATVLEVSGSDVYDMYVGEGEKNVKAIFSLAKKLTPCIVFIDEADAILGSRGGSSNRTSHRELINQFLREWDGMNDLSAFIMVATNRPFDLDEASLRRLPRRLLVDLPVEKDREEILKIHLKDEILDPAVSLATLAGQTPFYSGSDLKNLAVAAALACVREEFETARTQISKTTSESSQTSQPTEEQDGHKYPEKRVLHDRHFKKAMDEISASVSEDMGSLSAIRKFDEKFGDRRGRRKKTGYGFLTSTEGEKAGSDAVRVRNQD